ncbi:MAG: hypothetical protein H6Q90_4516 [Deltaproteobacteria bacterium]|nr:hypothetical protein [Deltaproteobacteria bacterium]
MRIRLPELCLGTLVCAAVAGGSAIAGPALDGDDKAAAPAVDTTPEPVKTDTPVEYGVGIRLRNVRIPKGELELFLERAGDKGASDLGIGVDLTRRRGNVELQLGFEFEHLQPGKGVWIEKGKNVANGDEADFVVDPEHALNGDHLGWFTFEFTFLNHARIAKNLSFRYGGGAGLGIITGSLQHYNIVCVGATNTTPEPGCKPSEFGGTGLKSTDGGGQLVKYGLPPVFPVVNAIIGLQWRPMDKMTVNLETGIRTFLFFGTSASYFF